VSNIKFNFPYSDVLVINRRKRREEGRKNVIKNSNSPTYAMMQASERLRRKRYTNDFTRNFQR
jgi:hypothetical protein